MSTAEKLLTIAENIPKVYNAGYEKGKSEGGGADTGLVDDIIEGELVNLENNTATKAGRYVFREWANLASVKLSAATSIEPGAFQGCPKLVNAEFSNVLNIATRAFFGCDKLEEVILNSVTYIDSQSFYDCSALEFLVISTDTVAVLANVNAFNSSSIASGTGFIYVPDGLVDSYKTATNWSTYASQIKPLSALEEVSV